MDRNTALHRVCSAASCRVRHPPPLPFLRSECSSTLQLSRGEALILVSLLSLGLWALIWTAVSLLR